jgi:hypothetical protein
LVTCKAVTSGNGKHKKTVQQCTTRLTSSPVKFTAGGASAAAVISRRGRVYARGTAAIAHGQTRLLLGPHPAIERGVYELTLSSGPLHVREAITIG